jgi:hypothetical protein
MKACNQPNSAWGADTPTGPVSCEFKTDVSQYCHAFLTVSPQRSYGAAKTRLPHAVPLYPVPCAAGPRRGRQGLGDPRPPPPAHRPSPASPASQAEACRSGPARRHQPCASEITLVLLVREARDAVALAPTLGRGCLDLPASPAGPATACPGGGAGDRPPRPRESSLGYQRIKGELGWLGIQVSATTIRVLLHRHGLDPAPRGTTTTWRAFLRRQAAGIIACDLLHRRHRVATTAGRAVLHRTRHPRRPSGRSDRQPRRRLGHPAGPQPHDRARRTGPTGTVSAPRP